MPTESKPIELLTQAPDFKLPATDGKTYSLKDFEPFQVLVVGFTCNHCPYVQAYETRMNRIVEAFSNQSVAMICINSNDDIAYPEDSFEKMKERAKNLKFKFHYLRDADQSIARAYNAACTPEFYVYDNNRILQYHGRLDDHQKDESLVKHHYLKDSIQALLDGKVLQVTQTSAIGCSIKWKN